MTDSQQMLLWSNSLAVPLEPDAVEVIVTVDGETTVFMASGSQSPKRIVSGLRRFLVARQAARQSNVTRW